MEPSYGTRQEMKRCYSKERGLQPSELGTFHMSYFNSSTALFEFPAILKRTFNFSVKVGTPGIMDVRAFNLQGLLYMSNERRLQKGG